MPTVAALTVWWTTGFNVLLFIAGLRNIPSELYEAAALDGATPRQRFWRVTWPLLWPVTALVLTLQLILQLKIFDQIYLTSQGGPFNSSYVLLLQVYREAFQLNHGGNGAAVAVVLVRADLGDLGPAVPGAAHRRPPLMTIRRLENPRADRRSRWSPPRIWFFPIYWALVTSLRTDATVITQPGLLMNQFHLDAFVNAIVNTRIARWYLNSIGTAVIITVFVIVCGMMCAYAISQLRFPGRSILYGAILVSFMVPIPALYVAQFVFMNSLGWVNTWAGIIAPQLVVPVVIIVYKQFFDAVPKEMREAVVLDGGGEYTMLFKVLPAAQLGHHHRARDHHLHRRLEQLLVAVPDRDLRGA